MDAGRYKSRWRSAISNVYRNVAPRGVQAFIDVHRSYRGPAAKRLIFVHVPRTAGTSIATAIYGHPVRHVAAGDIRKVLGDGWKIAQHCAVVRHPLARAFSAYRYIKDGGTRDVPADWRPEYSSAEFATFDSFVRGYLFPRRHRLREVDQVFHPQHWFTHENGQLLVENIYRYEFLDRGIRGIEGCLGRPLDLPRLNLTPDTGGLDPDGDTVGMIEQIYERDYALFGYEAGHRAGAAKRSNLRDLCDFLVCSTDSFVQEATVTIERLRALGLTDLMDCFLSLGELKPKVEGFAVINRREAGTWSSELLDVLKALRRPYVFLWLDDLVPISTVPLPDLSAFLIEGIRADVNYLRLHAKPKGHGGLLYPGAREIVPGEMYRTSTVCTVWKRDVLMSLLRSEESAWEFEHRGSIRSDTLGLFATVDESMVRYENLVVKGRVDPRAESALMGHGIRVGERVTRPRMTRSELAALRLREARSALFQIVPWQWRRRIRSAFRVI